MTKKELEALLVLTDPRLRAMATSDFGCICLVNAKEQMSSVVMFLNEPCSGKAEVIDKLAEKWLKNPNPIGL